MRKTQHLSLFIPILWLLFSASAAHAANQYNYINSPLRLGSTDATPPVQLDVVGTAKVGSSLEACNSTSAGAIRWNGKTFEGCNGTTWGAFYGSGTNTNSYSIQVGDSSVTVTDTSTNGTVLFATDGVPRAMIDANGNWGVGVVPRAKLDVGGSLKIGDGAETCGSTYAGAIRYNSGVAKLQYCNGTAWTDMKLSGAPAGAGYFVATDAPVNGCLGVRLQWVWSDDGATVTIISSSGQPTGLVVGENVTLSGVGGFNGTYTISNIETNDDGRESGQVSMTGGSVPVDFITDYDYPDMMLCRTGGGRAAADAMCLAQLTHHTGWWGYASANAAGLLNSTKVKAFICDDSACNNLQANTTYYYANTDYDDSVGGRSFTTNASGQGTGEALANWNGVGYFFTPYIMWTGRHIDGNASLWATTPETGSTCGSWTSTDSNDSGIIGYGTGFGRWALAPLECDGGEYGEMTATLICYVNP